MGPFFSSLLRRRHDAAAALGRAAATDVKLLELSYVARSLVLVIVGKLHAGLNVFQRVNPDPVIVDYRFAVGIAGVIYEAGNVAPDIPVDAVVVVEGEEKGMVTRHPVLVIPLVRLVVVDLFAGVFDDLLP